MKSDSVFLTLFTFLCVVFVPVYFFYGYNDITVPLSAVLFDSLRRYLADGTSGTILFGWICIGLYVVGFMIIGSSLVRITAKLVDQKQRVTVRLTLLFCVFLFSFAPVITYKSMSGQGGTYNFWTATSRYFQQLG